MNLNLNTILVIVTGVLGVVYIIALTGVFIWYRGDVVIAATLLTTGFGALIASIQSYRQSASNNTAIQQIDAKVDDNTATTDATHHAVNSRMDEFMARVQQLANVQEQLSNALALAKGITVGRAQMGAQPDVIPLEGGPDATNRT